MHCGIRKTVRLIFMWVSATWHEQCNTSTAMTVVSTLQWRHNDHDGVSNHQLHGCLLNRLFRRRSKKTSKLRVTGLCVGNSPGPVNSPHKWPVTRKMFPFDDVIMNTNYVPGSCSNIKVQFYKYRNYHYMINGLTTALCLWWKSLYPVSVLKTVAILPS